MERREALLCLAAAGLPLWAVEARASEAIAVIVNRKNDVSDLSFSELEAIFTTRKVYWSGNQRIVPFNFPPKHPVRVNFDRRVLHMDPDQVARYWIDRRVRGGNRPPRQLASGELVVRVVSKLETAIGYVPESLVTDLVKVVRKL